MAKDQILFGRRVLEEALKASLSPTQIFCENRESESFVRDLLRAYGQRIPIQSVSGKRAEISSQGVSFKLEHEFYLDDLPENWTEIYPRVLLCNHLEDIQNLGSIVRSAAAMGFNLIVHESRRSFRMNAAALRISQGHAFHVNFYEQSNLLNFVMSLQKRDYPVYALEAGSDSLNLYESQPEKRLALVVGSEAKGISKPILKKIDFKINIPMQQGFDSLNASHAASIAMSFLSQSR